MPGIGGIRAHSLSLVTPNLRASTRNARCSRSFKTYYCFRNEQISMLKTDSAMNGIQSAQNKGNFYSVWKAFRWNGKTWNCILLVTDILCILS